MAAGRLASGYGALNVSTNARQTTFLCAHHGRAWLSSPCSVLDTRIGASGRDAPGRFTLSSYRLPSSHELGFSPACIPLASAPRPVVSLRPPTIVPTYLNGSTSCDPAGPNSAVATTLAARDPDGKLYGEHLGRFAHDDDGTSTSAILGCASLAQAQKSAVVDVHYI